jgi:ribonucleotide reductase alpha subunit
LSVRFNNGFDKSRNQSESMSESSGMISAMLAHDVSGSLIAINNSTTMFVKKRNGS